MNENKQHKRSVFTDEERSRIKYLCYYTKKGQNLTTDDRLFLQAMVKKNDKEYNEIHKKVVDGVHKEMNPLAE